MLINRTIHNYASLEENQVYKILQEDIKDFKKFLKIIELYSKNKRSNLICYYGYYGIF